MTGASAGLRVLFVCARNRLRSPTAEAVFGDWPGIEVRSAGVNPDADTPIDAELVNWADVIFVMEKSHREKLARRFRRELKSQRMICLNIRDDFTYMDERLIKLLMARVPAHLGVHPPVDRRQN